MKKNERCKGSKVNNYLSVLIFLSLFSNGINYNIGFSITPSFVLSIFILFFIVVFYNKIFIPSAILFRFILMFYMFCWMTFFYSDSHLLSFRFVLGSVIFIFTIIVFYSYFKLSCINVSMVYCNFSKIYLILTAFYYVLGLWNFNASLEHESIYGIFVEKSLPRLTGLTIDPNFAALTLSFCFFYCFFQMRKGLTRTFYSLLSFILILLTLSSSGLIATLFSLLICFFLRLNFNFSFFKKLVVTSFLITILAFALNLLVIEYSFLVDVIEKRSAGIQTGSGRFEIWRNAILMFLENPGLGSGIFTFRHLNFMYFGVDLYAHNTFLEILVETGLIGFTIFMLAVLFMVRRAFSAKASQFFLFPAMISFLVMSNTLSLYLNSVFIFYVLSCLMIEVKDQSL